MSLFLCLCLTLSISLPVSVSLFLSVSACPVSLFSSVSVSVSVYLSVYFSASISPSSISPSLSLWFPLCLSASVYLSVYTFVYLSVSISLSRSLSLSACLLLYLFISVWLSVCLSLSEFLSSFLIHSYYDTHPYLDAAVALMHDGWEGAVCPWSIKIRVGANEMTCFAGDLLISRPVTTDSATLCPAFRRSYNCPAPSVSLLRRQSRPLRSTWRSAPPPPYPTKSALFLRSQSSIRLRHRSLRNGKSQQIE